MLKTVFKTKNVTKISILRYFFVSFSGRIGILFATPHVRICLENTINAHNQINYKNHEIGVRYRSLK